MKTIDIIIFGGSEAVSSPHDPPTICYLIACHLPASVSIHTPACQTHGLLPTKVPSPFCSATDSLRNDEEFDENGYISGVPRHELKVGYSFRYNLKLFDMEFFRPNLLVPKSAQTSQTYGI